MIKDVRNDWFMRQHFSKEELQQLYEWELESNKICKIKQEENYFTCFHIKDSKEEIALTSAKEEYMLRR